LALAIVEVAFSTSVWAWVIFQDLQKNCTRSQAWKCNVSLESGTTEQLREVDDALKWYRGVDDVERPHWRRHRAHRDRPHLPRTL